MAEAEKSGANLLLLCPSCHIMFDTHLKPRIYKALRAKGIKGLPKSWEAAIYEQAANRENQPRPGSWESPVYSQNPGLY